MRSLARRIPICGVRETTPRVVPLGDSYSNPRQCGYYGADHNVDPHSVAKSLIASAAMPRV
jgi:hypothetical protein